MDEPSADTSRATRHAIVGVLAAALVASANRIGLLWGRSWTSARPTAPSTERRGR